MELSSKRVFRMRGPISICWPPHPYELLESTPEADGGHEKRKPNRRSAPPTLRLGRRRKIKGLFIPELCKRFHVRILRAKRVLLLLKRLKAFYLRFVAKMMEAAPAVEMVMNSTVLISPHS